MSVAIVPIVEGRSEVESVPVLLRRILLANEGVGHVLIARPFRVKRNRVVREGEPERAVQQAIRDRSNAGCILVLLEADDDCPAELGPSLLKRCQQVTQFPAAVVIANKELEGWFLGAKESSRGVRGIRQDATAPSNPESIRGAKERLSKNMRARRYLEVDDQPALAAKMDFELARQRCPSFRKLLRDVQSLLGQL